MWHLQVCVCVCVGGGGLFFFYIGPVLSFQGSFLAQMVTRVCTDRVRGESGHSSLPLSLHDVIHF